MAASSAPVATGLPREAPQSAEPAHYTAWTFGERPERMKVRRGPQVTLGSPAFIDNGDFVEIEVFDEPAVAAFRHCAGLRRLVALQNRDPLKYLEKNIPEPTCMALSTLEELREQIIDVALDRAFLADPLPTDAASFGARIDEGRAHLNLIAQEVARLAVGVLTEHAAAVRKLKDSKPGKDTADDITAQLQRLVSRAFLRNIAYPALRHLPRYLKAVVLRLDKLRADPPRDAARLAELRPPEQCYLRRLAEQRGTADARLDEYRWLLEELRVSLFAQELRTPQPVSAKRLDKASAQPADRGGLAFRRPTTAVGS